jgi:hypothetical protein
MVVSVPVYCSREDVKRALDIAETARNNVVIDDAIASGSRSVDDMCHRVFYPTLATRYFGFPERLGRTWRLWLDENEIISIDELSADGLVMSSSDFYLEPANSGPPYTYVEVNRDTVGSFAFGGHRQRDIAIEGAFGYKISEQSVGELTSELAADANASASITFTTGRIGVGDLFRIGDERMIVTRRTMVDSTQNIGDDLTASKNDVLVPVTDGTAFAEDTTLLIGAERMLIVDIAGDNLIVKRAYDGTVLAAHTTGADVYTLSGAQLERAVLGTTLAVHASGAAIQRFRYPSLVTSLAKAEAINILQQDQAGWGRTAGTGDTEREMSAKGLDRLRRQVFNAHGRKLRTMAV